MGKKPKTTTVIMESQNDTVPPQTTPPSKKLKRRKRPDPIQFTIETLPTNSTKSLPLIGYFPSGYDPAKRKRADNQPSVTVMKHVKRNNRIQIVVKPSQSSPVNFVGTNYSGEAAAPQICSYALGVLDKETNTLRIVQIEANKIFRLEPRFGDEDKAEEEVSKAVEDEHSEKEDIQAKYNFSTKKSQLTAKRERALRASNRDPVVQEDLNKKMAEEIVNTEALEMSVAATSIARNIPPHDMSATIPQLAYPLEKIIFKGEWRYLLDIAELLQQGRDIKSGSYPLFVCSRIHKIEEVKDEEAKESLACIFSYINHLIKFKDKNSMDFASAKHHKIPTILDQKFKDLFGANTETKRLVDDKRDLLISYILVLTLFVDNFRTEFSDIAKDLRMSAGELTYHYQFLGCKFIRENNIKLATLPAPLKFQEPKPKRRNR